MTGLAVQMAFRRTLPTDRLLVEKWDRPATKGEAREQVRKVFEECEWGPGEQSVYFETLGLGREAKLEEMPLADLRTIIADLERSHMILYKN